MSLDLDKEIENKLSGFENKKSVRKTDSNKEVVIGTKEKFNLAKAKEKIKKDKENKNKKSVIKKEKKPFIQDLGDIFADNFVFAWSSFKSAFLSLFLGGKSLYANKIFILIFISIPAILGGTSVFVAGLVLILLWILFMILKKSSDTLQKIEDKIKYKISSWKKLIRSNKKPSLPEKIVKFGIYTLAIGANGAMYLLVKGVKIPIKSLSDIAKYVGNMVDKLGETLNLIAKTPAKLHNKALQKKGPKLVASQSLKAQKMAIGAQRRQSLFDLGTSRARSRTRAQNREVKQSVKQAKQLTRTKAKVASQAKQIERKTANEKQASLNKKDVSMEMAKQESLSIEEANKAELRAGMAEAKASELKRANDLQRMRLNEQMRLNQQMKSNMDVDSEPDLAGHIIGDLENVNNLANIVSPVTDIVEAMGDVAEVVAQGAIKGAVDVAEDVVEVADNAMGIAGHVVGGAVREAGEAIEQGAGILPRSELRKDVKNIGSDIREAGAEIQEESREKMTFIDRKNRRDEANKSKGSSIGK